MSGYNVVKFTVKDGMDEKFLDTQKQFSFESEGFRNAHMIKTGDHDYCFIGEWESAKDSLNAEDKMVSMLNQFRDCLDNQGDGKGITDAIVGDVVIDYH